MQVLSTIIALCMCVHGCAYLDHLKLQPPSEELLLFVQVLTLTLFSLAHAPINTNMQTQREAEKKPD